MIATFDLHDRAYYVWRDAGVRAALLVHVDAHHDAARAESWTPIDIGNYVRAAIRDGMIAAVRWIVPDPMWSDAATRRILRAELRAIGDRHVADAPGGAHTAVDGVELWMGPLAGASLAPAGPVLLDIDVDYLLTARYESQRTAEPLAVPWCCPADLINRLRAHGIDPLITTIASSVTGGFTPLRWAHLAREIAARLGGDPPPSLLACCEALADAARRREAGDNPGALDACLAAVAAAPAEPAAHFHLAQLLQAAGREDEARAAYRRTLERDPSYAHAFMTRGPYLYRRGRLREAEAAYSEALALDPDDSHAHLGLAMVAMKGRYPADARRHAERSLAARPEAVDGWRTLAEALARLGERAAAIQAYGRALRLSLGGATPLGGPWTSNPEGRLVDPRHWGDHAAVGDLHAASGDLEAAIAHYRMAAAGDPGARRLGRRLRLLETRRRIGRASGGMLPS